MKKTILALALVVTAVTASAQYGYRPHHNHGYSNRDLGIGLIIGSLGTSLIYESRPPVYVPPPVYYPPVYVPAPVYVPPPVVYLQDGTRLTYSHQSALWVDQFGNAYSLPR